jgi:predicted metal-dependent HD superfamily phosphohydrolase
LSEQLLTDTALHYTTNTELCNSLWLEIVKHYSEKKRHYNTITHLQNLVDELTAVKTKIEDWDTVVFAVFYHDIFYHATAKDNEEKSAKLAQDRLAQIAFPEQQIKKCVQLILATKGHDMSNDADTNLFTDADLSVLGKPWNVYEEYYKNVRKEYSIFPDFLYKPGRIKVLQHFLSMEKIYKTEHFAKLYETQARQNMQQELEMLR